MNALFDHFAFGNVGHNDDQALHIMVLIAYRTDTGPAGAGFAIGFAVRNLALPVAIHHQCLADHGEKVRLMLFCGNQEVGGFAQYVFVAVTTDAGKGLVGFHYAQLRVGNQNGFVTVVEYFGGQLQLAFQLPRFADIAADADNALQFTVIVP